jgi:xylan 1,4-beta-xylosidase
MDRYGLSGPRGLAIEARRLRLRLTNDRNTLTMHSSQDIGRTWQKFDVQMEVSGYHHNVAYDFLSLRPALYASGAGEARFSNFTYQAL